MNHVELNQIREQIHSLSLVEKLTFLSEYVEGKAVFSTSFGQEDQVITDILFKNEVPVKVFAIDTGRLFEETYEVYQKTLVRYKKPIEVFFPDNQAVQELLGQKGPFSFYKSVENRKECCHIRKVEPLQRALKGQRLWVTGLRASQSNNRNDLAELDWDENYNLLKFNPLLTWSLEEVETHLKEHNVPYNVLHDKGFPSIGCAPCTRAVTPGEDIRAGRWWWEQDSGKECGLHEGKKRKFANA